MKFIDEATITVQSGHGGSGCVSFRREKFIPRGGPNGGDGGRGGDVVFVTTSRRRTLRQFRYKKQFSAPNGGAGRAQNKTGKNGAGLTLEIPPGTIISDYETGELIKDLTRADETYVIANGGRGGQGNARFKSSTHRSPRFAQPGEPGQFFKLNLELKLLADVGLIGLPNAGKSTLISTLSAARPKVADYPFTTLTPNLGVVQTDWDEPFVVADIPGLIAGAHQGAGLGIQFLKHIERTHILVHLIDAAALQPDAPLADYETVNRELSAYDVRLGAKAQVVVLTKMDLVEDQTATDLFTEALAEDGQTVLKISAPVGTGIESLKSEILRQLQRNESQPTAEPRE